MFFGMTWGLIRKSIGFRTYISLERKRVKHRDKMFQANDTVSVHLRGEEVLAVGCK